MDNEIDNYESNLYKYLALNDTIHDFGKGEERGGEQRLNINNIVENVDKNESFEHLMSGFIRL